MDIDTLLNSAEWIKAGGYVLLTMGFCLLVIEFFVPSFGFFGFAGITSLIIGVAQLHQTGDIGYLPVSSDILAALVLIGIILCLTGGIYSFYLFTKKVTTGTESMIGKTASIIEWQDNKGHVRFNGEIWQAYNEKAVNFRKEEIVKIITVEDLKIKIERI